MTDEQIRELINSSPGKAHRLIFDEYYNYVYTIVFNCLKSVTSREDIDECISDVFAEIFMKYKTNSEHEGDIKGFVASISRNRAIDMFRRLRSRKVVSVSIDGEEAISVPSPEKVDELAEKNETSHALLDAVKSLGEPDSTIIMQKYYYGRSSSEIAGFVSLKPAAIRKRLSRAMEKLKKILTDMGEER